MANRAQRSSILKSIIMYIGIGIGAVSTLFIYPLHLELYGALQFLITTAGLFVPIATFGSLSLTNRYFPFFQDNATRHHGFFGLLFISMTVGLILFGLIGLLAKEGIFYLLGRLNLNIDLIKAYLVEIYIVTFALAMVRLSTMYLVNFKRIVATTIVGNFLPKIILPAIILLSSWKILQWHDARWIFVVSQVILAILLLGYVMWLGQFTLKPDWKFMRQVGVRDMRVFASYGLLRNLANLITTRVDTIMIATMIDLRYTGIYAIALFISNIILIPKVAIVPIWTPDIARCSKEGRTMVLGYLYKKSANMLYFFSALVFMIIWFNIEDIFSFSSKTAILLEGKYVVLYIGLAKLMDALFGLNGAVLSFSTYYRFNVLLGIFISSLSIVLNLILIPKIGIDGAAVATLISITLFNVIKYLFVKRKLDIDPWSKNLTKILLLSLATTAILYITPSSSIPFINIMYKTALVLLCFALPILRFRWVPDLPALLESSMRNLKERIWRRS